MIPSVALIVLFTAVFLKLVTAILPKLEMEGFAPAVIIAVLIWLAGWGLRLAAMPLIVDVGGVAAWILWIGLGGVVNGIVLALAANTVSGFRSQSVAMGFVAGVFVEALRRGAAVLIGLSRAGVLFREPG